MSPKKILLIGHMQHGKDTVAGMLKEIFNIKFESSSEAAARIFLFDTLKEKYGYKTFLECFNDRIHHRKEWFDLICDFNKSDSTRLAKLIMEDSDVYVGMRDDIEIETCLSQGIFDMIIGVYDPRKDLEPSDSFNIDIWKRADIIIPNGSTLEELHRKVRNIGPLLYNASSMRMAA